MIEYNRKNAKRWSVTGERPTFGMAVHELAKDNKDILIVVADVVGSAGLERMRSEMPDRIINVGIAEQNMIGIATGLSSEGFTVFTSSFAPFQTMRCLEQIRVNQGYMEQKIIMTGLAGGVAYGELGHTHCTIEDLSIIRSIPNIAVVSPADCTETVKLVEAAITYDKSVYIRLMGKTNVPVVYTDDYDFEIGKAVCLTEGEELAILANGTMVAPAVAAAKKFEEIEDFRVSVYDFHTIKPLDTGLLDELANNHRVLITVEEHNLIGGLGSAVSEYYSDKRKRPLIQRMGIPDEYCHGASHETIMDRYNLTSEGIYNKLKMAMEVIK